MNRNKREGLILALLTAALVLLTASIVAVASK